MRGRGGGGCSVHPSSTLVILLFGCWENDRRPISQQSRSIFSNPNLILKLFFLIHYFTIKLKAQTKMRETIMARYEAEEEEFLQELAKMQAECAEEEGKEVKEEEVKMGKMMMRNKRGGGGRPQTQHQKNGQFGVFQQQQQQPAMLGTLCTLIGEIAKLRHENGNLKKRMINNGNGQKNSGGGVDCAASASSPPPLLGAAVPKSIQFECDLGGVNSSSGNNSIISSSCLPNQTFNIDVDGGGGGGSSLSCCSSSGFRNLFGRQQNHRLAPMRSTIGGRKPSFGMFNGGRREQLSSPTPLNPHEKPIYGQKGMVLSGGAYSADLSSDSSLFYATFRRRTNCKSHEGVEAEEGKYGGGGLKEEEEEEKGYSAGLRLGRNRQRAKRGGGGGMDAHHPHHHYSISQQGQHQLLRLSSSMTTTASGTSPSAGSSSASSSVERPPSMFADPKNGNALLLLSSSGTINNEEEEEDGDGGLLMSSSNSRGGSFLDLFGLHRRRSTTKMSKAISSGMPSFGLAFSNAMDSLMATTRNRKRQKFTTSQNKDDAGNGNGGNGSNGLSPPYSPAHSPFMAAADGYSSGGSGNHKAGGGWPSNGNMKESKGPTNLMRSAKRIMPKKGDGMRGRPQSCYMLDPTMCSGGGGQKAEEIMMMKGRTMSCRNVTEMPEEKEEKKKEEEGRERANNNNISNNAIHQIGKLKMEIQLLKTRNARLIEQLREKSSRLSAADAKMDKLGRELENAKRWEQFSNHGHLNYSDKLGELELAKMERQFNAKLEAFKLKAQQQLQQTQEEANNQRKALEGLQHCQRTAFTAAITSTNGNGANELAGGGGNHSDLLPSFDALYSFAVGLVQKLAQMRARLGQKCADELQAGVELLQSQSKLLIANAQLQRQSIQLALFGLGLHGRRRPASFHGICHSLRLAHGQLQFIVPFKLHGQRVNKWKWAGVKKTGNGKEQPNGGGQMDGGFNELVERNEQTIETEFLRLFDSARSLTRICHDGNYNGNGHYYYCDCHTRRQPNSPSLIGRHCSGGGEGELAKTGPSTGIKRRIQPKRTQSSSGVSSHPPASSALEAAASPKKSPPFSSSAIPRPHLSGGGNHRRNSLIHVHNNQQQPGHSPLASPNLFKIRRLSALLQFGANGNGSNSLCSSAQNYATAASTGTPELTKFSTSKDINANGNSAATTHIRNGRLQRPLLVRRPSQSPLRRRATEEDECHTRQKHILHQQCQQPQHHNHLRPPTPSAPPISPLLQSSIWKGADRHGFSYAEGNVVSQLEGNGNSIPTCTTTTNKQPRPFGPHGANNNDELPPRTGANVHPNSRSSSVSRLPKAVAMATTTASAKGQSAPLTHNEQEPEGMPKLPKSVKKASTSWLSRLRGRKAATENAPFAVESSKGAEQK